MFEPTDPIQVAFLSEAVELQAALEQGLLSLEDEPAGGRSIDEIFRAAHTLKGSAGVAGLGVIEGFMHHVENFLDLVRQDKVGVTASAVTVLLGCNDVLLALLTDPDTLPPQAGGLLERLGALASGSPAPSPGAAPAAEAARAEAGALTVSLVFETHLFESGTDPLNLIEDLASVGELARVTPLEGGLPPWEAYEPTRTYLGWEIEVHAPAPAVEKALEFVLLDHPVGIAATPSAPAPIAETSVPVPNEPARPEAAAPAQAGEESPAARAAAPQADTSIRVGVALLDKLMNLVGELVLNRNQILQHVRNGVEPALAAPVQRLNLITTELQEAVMQTRMQPIRAVWDKFPRLVRDYGHESGKRIELVMEGAETELDKSLLEVVKDPLTHVLRNAMDHGLEMPEARVAAGKPAVGTITLLAYHEGGQVNIEVRDDGKGLDLARIRAKAVERGIHAPEAAGRLSDAELMQLVFHPGFSTAEKVSALSGRGVGMDVVKTNLEKIGGTIDLQSRPGQGTTIRMCVPLTLAVMPALIIHAGTERFAIPQSELLEVVRTDEHGTGIERLGEATVYRLRDTLIPIVALRSLLGMPFDGFATGREINLVILQAGNQVFGLAIDEIGDTEEIVVKGTHRFYQGLAAYSGVTILGDGRPCLILDVEGLAELGALSDGLAQELTNRAEGAAASARGDYQQMLLVRLGGSRIFCIPMALVARLEVFPTRSIETVGARRVMQYADGLLHVLSLESLLGLPAGAAGSETPVVVVGEDERKLGLEVGEILDIIEDNLVIHPTRDTPGILGAAVIDGQAREVLDLHAVIERQHPEWFRENPKPAAVRTAPTILLAEDSAFFRTVLKNHLTSLGYQTLEAADGEIAYQMLEKHEHVAMLLSDIEMPNLTGLQLIARIRKEPRFAELPCVALTTRATPEDRERGLAAGFDAYMPKYDREAVAQILETYTKLPEEVRA